jgi:16S rRNA (guanine527-N7)-methyltransferase
VSAPYSPICDRSVSRETQRRLEAFKSVFDQWQPRINLVSPHTVDDFWQRHVIDSLQLLDHAPENARVWMDLGSGGGFPGLIVAAHRSDQPDLQTILVESNGKKAAFLREAARIAGIRADIKAQRLETVVTQTDLRPDIITARALAPLMQLVVWTEALLKTGSLGLYLKGKDARSEIEAFKLDPELQLTQIQSAVDPAGSVIAIWNPAKCAGPRRL